MCSIFESEMMFGIYPDEDVFWVEKSQTYIRSLKPNGVKCCKFILNRGKNIYFIEAKTTCPNQITADSEKEKKTKYREYIEDITNKMRHSLSIFASILLGRYGNGSELPPNLAKKNLAKKTLKLVLVVKKAKPEWLEPLQIVLNRELRKECSIWRDVRLYAINEEQAQKKGLLESGEKGRFSAD